jgi:carbon-monoxide dehydrogenase small subunit
MVMVSKALLDHDPAPSDGDIRQALTGNICRCTGYRPIVDAVHAAAAAMGGSAGEQAR